jgi:hypothetical protein
MDVSLPAIPALLSRTSTGPPSDAAKASKVSGWSTSSLSTFAPIRVASVAVSGSRTAATTS